MSDRMTSVSAPGIQGFAEYGRLSRKEMVDKFLKHYERKLFEAQKALATPHDEIIVETYIGVYAMRNLRRVTE